MKTLSISGSSFETVTDKMQFAEGPFWHPGGYWLFSDVESGLMWKYSKDHGLLPCKILDNLDYRPVLNHLSNHHGPNGIALSSHGHLLICHHGMHAVMIYDDFGCRPLIQYYRGKPLNSPNDLVVSGDSTIYFTDPPYGLKNQVLNPKLFQDAGGIFRYRNGDCVRLSTVLKYPNGLCFSPDRKSLYVSSNHPDEQLIIKLDVENKEKMAPPRIFAKFNSDGMACDHNGYLYLSGSENLRILYPDGRLKKNIPMPSMTTNIAIGGWTNDELLVTAGQYVFHFEKLPINVF